MSTISFVRVDTQEVIGRAPLADWWMVAGEVCSTVLKMKDEASRAKLMALMSLGNDCRKPPRQLRLTELDIVDWHWACSVVMIRLLKQVSLDVEMFLDTKDRKHIDLTKLWSHKASTSFVELLALNMALLDAHCVVEAREIRTPLLKVI